MIGLRTFYVTNSDVVFTSDNTPATVGLSSPIAANQRQKVRWYIPFVVGATGGFQCQVSMPAGASIANASFSRLSDPDNDLIYINAGNSLAEALAGASNCWLELEATVINGSTAGNVDLLCAQNTVDPLSMTVYQGGTLEVIKF
jgi:hypothetical protein